MTVLVTDCQYRTTPAIIRELGCNGHAVMAVTTAGRMPIGSASRYVAQRHTLPASTDALQTAQALAALCAEQAERPVLLPVGRDTLNAVAQHRQLFANVADLLVADPDTLEQLNDKIAVKALADKLHIATPATLDPADYRQFAYPVILKYTFGEGLGLHAGQRYAIAHNADQFQQHYDKMKSHPLLVSEFIEGDGWGVSVVMDAQSRPVSLFCHRRLRQYPLTGGPSTLCRSEWHDGMVKQAVALLQAVQFTGIAMVEFKGSADNWRLLEINPRVWGSAPLAVVAGAGFFSAYAAACTQTLPQADSCAYTQGVAMQYLVGDTQAALAQLKRGRLAAPFTLLATLLSRSTKGGVYDRHDRKPALAYFKSLLKRVKS